jgi:hypothetical protein
MFIALSILNTLLDARMTSHVPDNADPYAKVRAVKLDGSSVTQYTNEKDGTLNPVWNQELSFGYGQWSHFHIQIWDDDSPFRGDDDSMTSNYRVDILTPCSEDTEKNTVCSRWSCRMKHLQMADFQNYRDPP